jgi:GNAT superfamily N-acetyltransferase
VLGPPDVGHRVVVRRIVGRRDDRPVFTDLLGDLLDWSETEITVRTKSGEVRVPKDEIARAKRVPDQRRRSATEALELAAAKGWPAAEATRLGDWWLRAAEGWTMRGNSALPIGDPGCPVPAAIDAVAAWYRARGLPPAISVPLPLLAGLDAELDRRGWEARPPTVVMTAPLNSLTVESPHSPSVRLDPAPSPAWLSIAANRKKALPEAALSVLSAVPEVRFAIAYGPTGAPVAIARGVVADEERRWLGLSLIETAAEARRRGLARQVIGALVDWAVSVGARDAYLQVQEHNAPAVALYERLGFTAHHTYVARVLT